MEEVALAIVFLRVAEAVDAVDGAHGAAESAAGAVDDDAKYEETGADIDLEEMAVVALALVNEDAKDVLVAVANVGAIMPVTGATEGSEAPAKD